MDALKSGSARRAEIGNKPIKLATRSTATEIFLILAEAIPVASRLRTVSIDQNDHRGQVLQFFVT